MEQQLKWHIKMRYTYYMAATLEDQGSDPRPDLDVHLLVFLFLTVARLHVKLRADGCMHLAGFQFDCWTQNYQTQKNSYCVYFFLTLWIFKKEAQT